MDEVMTAEEDCGSDVGMERESDPANEESFRSLAARSRVELLVCGIPKVAGGKLPAFSLRRYTMNVSTGLGREKALRDQEKLEEARRKAEWRDMWTTPGEVPLIMAPRLGQSWLDKNVKSDMRYQKLFPGDVVKQGEMKVIDAEVSALDVYNDWLYHALEDDEPHVFDHRSIETSAARRTFYKELKADLRHDQEVVRQEWWAFMNKATPLGLWEFRRLDNDGGTIELEHQLQAGMLFNDENHPDVKAHYGALLAQYPLVDRFRARCGDFRNVRREVKVGGLWLFFHYDEETWNTYGPFLDSPEWSPYASISYSKLVEGFEQGLNWLPPNDWDPDSISEVEYHTSSPSANEH